VPAPTATFRPGTVWPGPSPADPSYPEPADLVYASPVVVARSGPADLGYPSPVAVPHSGSFGAESGSREPASFSESIGRAEPGGLADTGDSGDTPPAGATWSSGVGQQPSYAEQPADDEPPYGPGPTAGARRDDIDWPPPRLAGTIDPPAPTSPAGPSPDEEPGESDRPPGRKLQGLAVVSAVLTLLFLGAALVGAGFVAERRGGNAGDAAESDTGTGADIPTVPDLATERVVTAPLGNAREVEFDLVNGTTTVALGSAELGADLYRITTPIDGDVVPRPINDGSRVNLHLVPSGATGPGAVEILLNSEVRWQVRLTGGVAQHEIDFTDGGLSGLDIAGGAARIELSLPRPDGTLSVRMTGGVNQFVIQAAEGVPAQVHIGTGAGATTIDGESHSAIAPDSIFTASDWEDAEDRYDIDAVGGVGALTLDRIP